MKARIDEMGRVEISTENSGSFPLHHRCGIMYFGIKHSHLMLPCYPPFQTQFQSPVPVICSCFYLLYLPVPVPVLSSCPVLSCCIPFKILQQFGLLIKHKLVKHPTGHQNWAEWADSRLLKYCNSQCLENILISTSPKKNVQQGFLPSQLNTYAFRHATHWDLWIDNPIPSRLVVHDEFLGSERVQVVSRSPLGSIKSVLYARGLTCAHHRNSRNNFKLYIFVCSNPLSKVIWIKGCEKKLTKKNNKIQNKIKSFSKIQKKKTQNLVYNWALILGTKKRSSFHHQLFSLIQLGGTRLGGHLMSCMCHIRTLKRGFVTGKKHANQKKKEPLHRRRPLRNESDTKYRVLNSGVINQAALQKKKKNHRCEKTCHKIHEGAQLHGGPIYPPLGSWGLHHTPMSGWRQAD
ncbi:hypothetical protein VP01_1483g4 [Puccinia sorghi]|uniref:Uncharacterized protein n=1 Tax=Puccinia sorghi TaxID=27349 RepID=A0A0L6VJN3_9BASI|nr:hypothetical protein VP01_1483g4 [Puccinia sorghi]